MEETASTEALAGRISVADRRLAALSPYASARRIDTYQSVQRLYERLWTGGRTVRAVAEGRTTTLPGFPYLRLEDRDGDGGADFFAYLPTRSGGDTKEFGAVFDLNSDGRPDWIAFNLGPAMGEEALLTWTNQHGVDRNGDGRFDLHIMNFVDFDGDGRAEPDTSAWVFDDDFDGRIDRAEIVTGRRAVPARVTGRRLATGHFVWPGEGNGPRIGDPMPTQVYDAFARDMVEVLRR